MDANALVESYIKLRDKKAELKKKFDEEKAELDEVMERIENTLLKTFQDTGIDTIKTAAGTAYRSTKSSASVADWDEFLDFVRKEEAWEFLGKHCSKEAIEQFKAANQDLPPGIDWREVQVVGFRRSSAKN